MIGKSLGGCAQCANGPPPTRFGAFNSGDTYIEPGMRLNTSVPAGYSKEAPGHLPGRPSVPGLVGPPDRPVIAALVIDRRPLPSFYAENAGTYRLGSAVL
jgi:hypothetical protein